MKTTIDIADDLIRRARRVQQGGKGRTLRSLVEEGLRLALERAEQPASYKYEPVVFDGGGVQEEFANSPWSVWRELGNER